jgi:hypothetical protein
VYTEHLIQDNSYHEYYQFDNILPMEAEAPIHDQLLSRDSGNRAYGVNKLAGYERLKNQDFP